MRSASGLEEGGEELAMFAVIYRWQVLPGCEAQFEAGWRRGTERIAAEFGGWGSRLHKAGEGVYIAYAQWPDEATWKKASPPVTSSASASSTRRAVSMWR